MKMTLRCLVLLSFVFLPSSAVGGILIAESVGGITGFGGSNASSVRTASFSFGFDGGPTITDFMNPFGSIIRGDNIGYDFEVPVGFVGTIVFNNSNDGFNRVIDRLTNGVDETYHRSVATFDENGFGGTRASGGAPLSTIHGYPSLQGATVETINLNLSFTSQGPDSFSVAAVWQFWGTPGPAGPPSAVVPEPSSLVLFGVGSFGLVILGRRKRRSRPSPVRC